MNVVIIEDDFLAAERLQKLVVEYDYTISISCIDSVQKSIGWFKANGEPDLVLTAIQLGDGLIFNLFEEVSISCPIIYTTAHKEYTFQAFKTYSVDYLLKPINKEELYNAIDKFKRLYCASTRMKNYNSANVKDNTEFDNISCRELEILKLISQGKSSSKIGELLCISENTVFRHRKNMLKKMNVKNASELISKAMLFGFL